MRHSRREVACGAFSSGSRLWCILVGKSPVVHSRREVACGAFSSGSRLWCILVGKSPMLEEFFSRIHVLEISTQRLLLIIN
ncbi:unnamed protein product [Dracunculus medinensis]|uniref:Uncharacterized protein n=1 Tax=Dracunculus medinensis TaxID=318479 RepID=A0A0N4UH49_DRAME|nr:unnamed protein product [Dracunculus medinensis]